MARAKSQTTVFVDDLPQFKHLTAAIGKDLQAILDDLSQATRPTAKAAARKKAAERARKKLEAYDTAITTLRELRRDQLIQAHGAQLDELRTRLAALDALG